MISGPLETELEKNSSPSSNSPIMTTFLSFPIAASRMTSASKSSGVTPVNILTLLITLSIYKKHHTKKNRQEQGSTGGYQPRCGDGDGAAPLEAPGVINAGTRTHPAGYCEHYRLSAYRFNSTHPGLQAQSLPFW